jgi:glycosyltransferase involved in cell wall biosynthesis
VALLTIYESAPDEREGLPFPVLHAGRKTAKAGSAPWRTDMLFFGRLVREIRRFRPDIVHTHTHVGKYWGRFAALIAGVPLIIHTEHNPCDFHRSALERASDPLLHRTTTRVVTFFREQGVSLSRFDRFPLEKLAIIPNGLSRTEAGAAAPSRAASRSLLGVPPHKYAIMVVGRMAFQKNQRLALHALAAMSEDVRKSVLVFFAGSGSDEVVLRGLARALDVEECVRFLGYRNDVPALLAGADLVLMTSWFEGMPLTLLEAMIAGVPIVSTPWLGAREMLGDGRFGFMTADYDASRVAAEVERALAHPLARRQIAERALRHVDEEYSIGRMVEAHRHLYLQVRGALT